MSSAAAYDDESWRAYVVPACLLVASMLGIGLLQYRPLAARPALVWFSPELSADQAFVQAAQAGGAILRHGPYPNSFVVRSAEDGFVQRLYRAGAWLVTDAVGRAGCGPSSPSPSTR